MRIAIDARSLTTNPTGVGHFLLAAVNVWSKQEPNINFFLLAHKPLHENARAALRQADNISSHLCPTRIWPNNGLWWMLTGFASSARALGATHIWGSGGVLPMWHSKDLLSLLTVHDLVFRSLPHTMALRTKIASGLLGGRSIRNADHIWAVSNYTASEIERYYPHRKSRTIAVGSGLNPIRTKSCDASISPPNVVQKYQIRARTLLFAGTLEPRKNLAFLLGLMPALSALGWKLLIVGGSGWGKSSVASIVRSDDFPSDAVVFCDYVSDAELHSLYRSVDFLISTSLMEGFGLPYLEAMNVGCPVIGPANSATIEVVGEGGVLVSGWNPDEWVSRIEEAIKNREVLRQKAFNQAAKFSLRPVCQEVTNELRNQTSSSTKTT